MVALADILKPKLIDVAQLCTVTSRSKQTIYRMMRRNELPPPVRVSGAIMFRVADVERWIEAGCPKMGAASEAVKQNQTDGV